MGGKKKSLLVSHLTSGHCAHNLPAKQVLLFLNIKKWWRVVVVVVVLVVDMKMIRRG
jgi:hypothetical protein